METLADLIGEKVEELAARFPTFRDTQAVRAYLLSSAFEVSEEDIGRRIGWRGNVTNLVRHGRILVTRRPGPQLITMEEMRAWLADVRRNLRSRGKTGKPI